MRSARVAPGVALAAAVGVVVFVMASRVDDAARFVTWPVVALAAVAAVVAGVGLERGLARPWLFAVWLVPGAVLGYLSAGLPVAAIIVLLVGLGSLAFVPGWPLAGLAAWAGLFVTVLVLLQGPAVECGRTGVSTSGPWWVHSSTSSGRSTVGRAGAAEGAFTVGSHTYAFTCRDGRLTDFHRDDVVSLP